MGKILRVVAYVSGLEASGGDRQTDYFSKKREHLKGGAKALARFGNALIESDCWKSAYPAEACDFEVVEETNLSHRPELRKLRELREKGEELSLVVVEASDLCRSEPHPDELAEFRKLIRPYLSVVFSASFSHEPRKSPLVRVKLPKDEWNVYNNGQGVISKIQEEVSPSLLMEVQGQLLAHTASANGLLQAIAQRRLASA